MADDAQTTIPPARREALLAQQIEAWPRDLAAARAGNPYATLCSRCYGRHAPPKDELCPHDPPRGR